MRNGGYISIGWPELDNLRDYEEQDKTSLKTKLVNVLEKKYPNTPQVIGKNANQILSFYFNISPQDVIVAVDGERVLGVGQAVGGYEYKHGLAFPHIIKNDTNFIKRMDIIFDSFENQLANKLKNGDKESFTLLFEQYFKKIYSLALRMCGNKEDAEYIVRKTFIQAFIKINGFKEESSIYTAICHNKKSVS